MLRFLGSSTRLNHVLPCLSITSNSNRCFLRSLLFLYLSLKGIITELGKSILLSISVILKSDQSISKTSQIQFFLSLTFSGFNLPLILNKWILPATLHNIIGTYEWVSDMNSNIMVLLENKQPLTKLVFFNLLVTK